MAGDLELCTLFYQTYGHV